MLFQVPQIKKKSLLEGPSYVTRSWKGVNEEMQTQQVPAPHSPSALRSQRGTGLLKTNPLMSRAGLSGQGGAATVLLSSPAPVEQVSPPGSKLFVDSGGLPSVKRKAFSLSHLACDVSQDLVGL